jgi:hypothetical protein
MVLAQARHLPNWAAATLGAVVQLMMAERVQLVCQHRFQRLKTVGFALPS